MSTPKGIVRVQKQDKNLLFQVEGRANMHMALPVRCFTEEILGDQVTGVRVDLRRCTYMDSTFLGTLLFIKRATERLKGGEFALVSPSPECCQLLQQMGLRNFYPTVTADEIEALAWKELATDLDDPDGFRRNVIQAHRELALLPGKPGEAFREVMSVLEKQSGDG
jgi:anti-anti-sigma factor